MADRETVVCILKPIDDICICKNIESFVVTKGNGRSGRLWETVPE